MSDYGMVIDNQNTNRHSVFLLWGPDDSHLRP